MDRADVVIIGGGVTGLSSAYWLTKAGLDVVVVEKGIVGWEASGRNGGISSRRGEELPVVSLARAQPINPAIIHYLNRLSDLLFVLARAVNAQAGKADVTW